MPEAIIKKFKDEYGKDKGKDIFYATAKKQGRNPETFKKEEEVKEGISGVVADPNAPEVPAPLDGPQTQPPMDTPAAVSLVVASPLPPAGPAMGTPPGLPEVPPGEVVTPPVMEDGGVNLNGPTPLSNVPPQNNFPPATPERSASPDGTLTNVEQVPATPGINENKEFVSPFHDKSSVVGKEEVPAKQAITEKKEEKEITKVAQGSPKNDGGPTTKPSRQVHKSKKDKMKARKQKHKPDWKKFDESVNLYISKTSRNSDIGVNSLEKMWKECVDEQAKGSHPRSSRKFWVEVKSKFDRKVNEVFLQEAKKTMTERQKLKSLVETFLEHVAKDKYVEAKGLIKEMTQSCANSLVSDRKVQYQKTLAEEIAKKIRETK